MEVYQLAYTGEQLDDAIDNVVSSANRSVWYKPPDWPDYDSLQLTENDPACAFFTYDTWIPIDDSEKKAVLFWYFYGVNSQKVRIDRGHVEDGVYVVDECIAENMPYAYQTTPYEIQLPLDVGQYVSYRVSCDDEKTTLCVVHNNKDVFGKKTPCVESYIHKQSALGNTGGGAVTTNHAHLVTFHCGEMGGGTAEYWNSGAAVPEVARYDYVACSKFGYMPFSGLGIKCKALYITNSELTMKSDAQNIFLNASGLHILDFTGSTITATSMNGCFNGCSNIRTLDLSGWVMTGVTNMTNAFTKMTALVDLTLPTMPPVSFSLSDSTLLSVESLLGVIAALPTLASGTSATLTLGATNTAKLTSEQLAVATGKGWTVA